MVKVRNVKPIGASVSLTGRRVSNVRPIGAPKPEDPQPVVQATPEVVEPKKKKKGFWDDWYRVDKGAMGVLKSAQEHVLDPAAGMMIGAVEGLIPGKQSGEKIEGADSWNPATMWRAAGEIRRDPNLHPVAGVAADIINPTTLIGAATLPMAGARLAEGAAARGLISTDIAQAARGASDTIRALETGKSINPMVRATEQGLKQMKAGSVATKVAAKSIDESVAPKVRELQSIATEQIKQDKPGAISSFFDELPGIKQGRQYERPSLQMMSKPENERILQAGIVQQAAKSEVTTRAMMTKIPMMKEMNRVFGNDVVHNAKKSDILFIGTKEQAKNPRVGTITDIVERSHLYNLNKAQINAVNKLAEHNNMLLDYTNGQYGTEIAKFVPDQGNFISHIPAKEANSLDAISGHYQALGTSSSKERVWETIADRVTGKTPFTPEEDLGRIIDAMDAYKARQASGTAFRKTIGGMDKFDVMELTHPKLTKDITVLRKNLATLQDTKRGISDDLSDAVIAFERSAKEADDLLELERALTVQEKDPTFGVRVVAHDRDNVGTIIKVNTPPLKIDRVSDELRQWILEQAKLHEGSVLAPKGNFDAALKKVSEQIRAGDYPSNLDEAIRTRLKSTFDRETGEWLNFGNPDWPRTGTLIDFLDSKELSIFDDVLNSDTATVFFKNKATGAQATVEMPMDQLTTLSHGIPTGTKLPDAMAMTKESIAKTKESLDKLRAGWKTANPVVRNADGTVTKYVSVKEGNLFRYYTEEQAVLIKKSLQTTDNQLLTFFDNVKATVFGGDFSPIIGVQGSLAALAHPSGFITALKNTIKSGKLMHEFSVDALVKEMADDPDGWGKFAASRGRPLSGTPAEYAGGFLAKIPGYSKVNEAMYIAIERQTKYLYDDYTQMLMKHGFSEKTARVAAQDAAERIIPLTNTARLGQSQARSKLLGALPTSYSFIRKPAEMMALAMKGYLKIGTRQTLTAAELSSVRLMTMMAGAASAVCMTSAAINAAREGKDPLKAALDAVNPDPMNGKFMNVIIGNIKLPIGGPYRSIFRMIYPSDVAGLGFPLPFAKLYSFFENRTNPVMGMGLDLYKNKDYGGYKIADKESLAGNTLQRLGYVMESALPLTVGSVVSGIRTGLDSQTIRDQGIGQALGVNINIKSKWAQYTDYVTKLAKEEGLSAWSDTAPDHKANIENYDDITTEAMNYLEGKYPELETMQKEAQKQLAQLHPDAKSTSYFAETDKYTTERDAIFDNIQTAYENNVPAPQIKTAIQTANKDYWRSLETISNLDEYKSLIKKFEEGKGGKSNQRDLAIQGYQAIMSDPKYINELGEIDFGARDKDMATLKSSLGADLWHEVLVNIEAKHAQYPEAVQKYYADMELLRPYWNIESQVFEEYSARPGYQNINLLQESFDKKWAEMKAILEQNQTDPRLWARYQARLKAQYPQLTRIDRAVADAKKRWKADRANRSAAIALKYWYQE